MHVRKVEGRGKSELRGEGVIVMLRKGGRVDRGGR